MTGLFIKTIVLSARNGKSNIIKNLNHHKDFGSFDLKLGHVLKVKLLIIKNCKFILMYEFSILQIWLSIIEDSYLQMTIKAFI